MATGPVTGVEVATLFVVGIALDAGPAGTVVLPSEPFLPLEVIE